MQIVDSWLQDMPQQFQGLPRIEALITAFARQLQEIQNVVDDLEKLTDIDTATGQNLDMVGNIVSLTRKEATSIIRQASDDVLTDDMYRKALRYKLLKNSSECTYEDIMKAVSLLWDTSSISYKEPEDRPATVLLSLPAVSLDAIDPAVGRVLAIKAAGVWISYTVSYWDAIPFYQYEKFLIPGIRLALELLFYEFRSGELKRFDGKWLLDGSVILNHVSYARRIPMQMSISMGQAHCSEKISVSCITAGEEKEEL